VSGNMIVYSNSSNSFSLVKRNAANSADITRAFTFPDSTVSYAFPGSSDTLAGLGTANSFTVPQMFQNGSISSVSLTGSATNTGIIFPSSGINIALINSGATTATFSSSLLTVSGNVAPGANNTYVLGLTTRDWKQLMVRTVQPSDITTTNTAGSPMALNSGVGDGSGAGSSITFGTPTTLGAGAGAQSLTTRVTIDSSGLTINAGVLMSGAGNQSVPGITFATGGGYGMSYDSANSRISFSAGGIYKFHIGSALNILVSTNIADSGNFIFGTGAGTKIGTSAIQKISFWGASTIAQPTTAFAAATLVSNGGTALTSTDTFDGYTLLQIVKILRSIGLAA
jgi:hypothetical protein